MTVTDGGQDVRHPLIFYDYTPQGGLAAPDTQSSVFSMRTEDVANLEILI
jgi:hypothetical protein